MRVRCWGARGSIPVCGPSYTKYGGTTTCVSVHNEDAFIVIDAGTGIQRLGNQLVRENIKQIHLLFTHFHWDHVMGLPFFKPIYQDGVRIDIFAPQPKSGSVNELIQQLFGAPFFPKSWDDLSADIHFHPLNGNPFELASFPIEPIPLNHPNGGYGYKIIEDGKSFVFLTDNEMGYRHPEGLATSDYRQWIVDADLLIHDAEFTNEEYQKTRGWGHSSRSDALQLAIDAGVARFGLFHHNQDRTDDEVDDMVELCHQVLRKSKIELKCFAVRPGVEIVV